MKGIIDINIKRKDGSTETRHEHNVVFDLQALKTKYYYNRQYGPLTGFCGFSSIGPNTYDRFCLSTLELDLTKPSVAIPALNSITSGTSSVWYNAPITSTISDKYRISSATWTAGEAITLKSIFFPYDSLFFAANTIGQYGDSPARYKRCVLSDDGLFWGGDWTLCLKPLSEAFKFTNNYMHGFTNEYYSGSSGDANKTTGVRKFVPYKLHDPTERFLFKTTSDTSTDWSYYPWYTTGEIQIKDAATNTVKRSFNFSQFANFSTSYLRRLTRVVNTGSKNFLLQPISAADGIRVWEIPDTATEETIQPSGMILAGKDVYASNSSSSSQAALSVADNVLIYRKNSASSQIIAARINDDLSVDIVPGANAAGITASSSSLNGDSYNNLVLPYMNTDSPWLYRFGSKDNYQFGNNGTYTCHFFNSTAANFSTPIVLAEGDVLTVSYKIEVA